jgi:hypothetical protein
MPPRLEALLTSGERRVLSVPGSTSSIGNVLGRLDDWIETEDGGWIQKRFIVEVRLRGSDDEEPRSRTDEYEELDDAAGELADQALR